MNTSQAVRLVLGVALTFGGYMHSAQAASCYAETTGIERCPPGSGPGWLGGGASGDPQDGQPKSVYVSMPYIDGNPYAVSCLSATMEQRLNYARWALSSFIAYESARYIASGGEAIFFRSDTEFEIVYPDGTYQSFYDYAAVLNSVPATGIDLVLMGPPSSCPHISERGRWPKLGESWYQYGSWQ